MELKGGIEMDKRTERELLDTLGGIRDSLEKLASDPEVEIEAGPAFCPHCGTMNPEVTVLPTEGSGHMLEYVFVAECHECNHTMFGIVESWSLYQTHQALISDMEERAGNHGK
jgi:hypothetical protein